jgi:hypothetical protein
MNEVRHENRAAAAAVIDAALILGARRPYWGAVPIAERLPLRRFVMKTVNPNYITRQ